MSFTLATSFCSLSIYYFLVNQISFIKLICFCAISFILYLVSIIALLMTIKNKIIFDGEDIIVKKLFKKDIHIEYKNIAYFTKNISKKEKISSITLFNKDDEQIICLSYKFKDLFSFLSLNNIREITK